MLSTKEIIEQAQSLPVEERVLVVDSLLRSLNSPESETDAKWTEVAIRRLSELRAGHVKAIPGDQVFARVRERLGK